jgi:hypothetical protein
MAQRRLGRGDRLRVCRVPKMMRAFVCPAVRLPTDGRTSQSSSGARVIARRSRRRWDAPNAMDAPTTVPATIPANTNAPSIAGPLDQVDPVGGQERPVGVAQVVPAQRSQPGNILDAPG